MSILKSIFRGNADKTIGAVGKAIDDISTSDEEKGLLKERVSEIVYNGLRDLYSIQSGIISLELKGNWLQRSWRPIVMLLFAAIVAVGAFIEIPYASDSHEFWGLLKLGLGGYVVGRTAEKITDKVTTNMDLPMLKKRDRANKYSL